MSAVLAPRHVVEVVANEGHTLQESHTTLVDALQVDKMYCPVRQRSHVTHAVAPLTELYFPEGQLEQMLVVVL